MAIGVDIGGTNIRVAVVDASGVVITDRSIPTDAARGPDAVIDDVVALVFELRESISRDEKSGGATLDACFDTGVGVPGPLSHKTGTIFQSANLPGWHNIPLRDILSEKLCARVVVDNDGNVAALGESWVGAGASLRNIVMLTLGTGVGGGIILDGCVHRGHFENAGELGHLIVQPDGLPCPCGQRGCLEQYASARAVAARVLAGIWNGERSSLSESDQSSLDARRVARAAQDGDTLCGRIWDDACRCLAIACVNIQHTINPKRIVLGGGMSNAGAMLLDQVREHLARQRWALHDDLPDIAIAKLGDRAGAIGAAGLVLQADR